MLRDADKARREGASLDHLPGVSSIGTGNRTGKPVIRGLSGNRISILSNGVAVDHQQFGVRHNRSKDAAPDEPLAQFDGAPFGTASTDACTVAEPGIGFAFGGDADRPMASTSRSATSRTRPHGTSRTPTMATPSAPGGTSSSSCGCRSGPEGGRGERPGARARPADARDGWSVRHSPVSVRACSRNALPCLRAVSASARSEDRCIVSRSPAIVPSSVWMRLSAFSMVYDSL